MLKILFFTALTTPLASTPGCSKKFLSSADKNEFITVWDIAVYGTNILFSGKSWPILHFLNIIYSNWFYSFWDIYNWEFIRICPQNTNNYNQNKNWG